MKQQSERRRKKKERKKNGEITIRFWKRIFASLNETNSRSQLKFYVLLLASHSSSFPSFIPIQSLA